MAKSKIQQRDICSTKQWYIVKKDTEPRWVAYQFTHNQLVNIHPSYKVRGPYKNLFSCLIASNNSNKTENVKGN